MQLVEVFFDAYKSLLNMKLDVKHNCVGIVGINESGKSNVLTAIHVLDGETKLSEADTPKMSRKDPFITYTFDLSNDEFDLLQSKCNSLFKKYIPEFDADIVISKKIKYNVLYNRQENREYRFFDLSDLKIDENFLILHPDKFIDKYQIKTNDGFKNIEDCHIISKSYYEFHLEFEQKIEK
jgi:predicted ATP-dependent endonuclease of OLD family